MSPSSYHICVLKYGSSILLLTKKKAILVMMNYRPREKNQRGPKSSALLQKKTRYNRYELNLCSDELKLGWKCILLLSIIYMYRLPQ
uniref:Putative ovule protein n=1 Tax=Solanum chacoense TaxID=4108 RepID=A0A0V0HPH2_SOLCH